jgi:transposase
VEGEHCPLARRGHSRDGKPGKLQIEFGLLTNPEGIPVAIEVFAGNTGDPTTFQTQVQKVKDRFGVGDVIWVADRGMLTSAQVEQLQTVVGARWVTALRSSAIRQLVAADSIQLSLFDTQNLAEVTDPRYPGERLIVCHNPLLAEHRAHKREAMLQATEKELAKVAAMAARGAAGGRAGLRGAAAIGERVGRVVNKYDMAKHFTRTITDSSFSYARKQESIAEEAALDGLYVLRTNVSAERLDTAGVVLAYKSLAHVERAFRHFKLSDLEVRPIYHYADPRVRAHLLLCLLAYLVQREMQQALAPLLFVDEAPPERPDPVAPAPRSAQATRKDQTQRTADGQPVHSFRTLLAHLGTLVKNLVIPRGGDRAAAFELLTKPTPLQERAFALLGLANHGL